MNSSVLSIKAEADRLISRLQMLGVPLKRTQAYEAVSAVHNFPDWNRFKAHLEHTNTQKGAASTPIAVINAHQKEVDHKMLILRAGEGKTSVITMRIADAIQRNNGIPVLIDLLGASTYVKFPAFIKSHMALINVFYNASGCITKIDAPSPGARALCISMRSEDYASIASPGARQAMTKAFCTLPKTLISNWPKGVLAKISTILVDEAHIFDETNEEVFNKTIPSLNFGETRIIIGTQSFRLQMLSDNFRFKICGSAEAINQARLNCASVSALNNAHLISSKQSNASMTFGNDETLLEDIASFVLSSIYGSSMQIDSEASARAWLFEKIHKELAQNKPAMAIPFAFISHLKDCGVFITNEIILLEMLKESNEVSWQYAFFHAVSKAFYNVVLSCEPKCLPDVHYVMVDVFLLGEPFAEKIMSLIRER